MLIGIAVRTAVGAVRVAVAPHRTPMEGSGFATPGRAYAGLLGLTLLNPMTIVYFAALVLGRQAVGGSLFFVLGAFLASASWQLLIAFGGSLVGRVLSGPRGRLATSLASSVLIVALAVSVVLSM